MGYRASQLPAGLARVQDDPAPVLGGDLNANGHAIHSLPLPVALDDAATRGFVETAIADLSGLTFGQLPDLVADLDAAGHDILNIGQLTCGPTILNNVSLVAELSTSNCGDTEGVRLEGGAGKLTLDCGGVLLEKLSGPGNSMASLALQDNVHLFGLGDVDVISAGGRVFLSGSGGGSYLHVGSEVHVISGSAVKITGVNSALVEILSHYNGSGAPQVAIGIQGEEDALVSRLTFDVSGNVTFDSLQGGLIPPRYTTDQIAAILAAGPPQAGFLVFNTTLRAFQYFSGTALKTVSAV